MSTKSSNDRVLLRVASGAALFAIAAVARADLLGDMNAYLDDFTSMNVNVTPPGAYTGQTSGLYTAGGVYVRTPVKNYQPFSVQMPKVTAGCGGIDVFTGAFSYLDGDNLKNAIKAIGQNAETYFFMLALDSLTPMIAEELKTLQTWADRVNQWNMNSCDAAKTLVDGYMGGNQMKSKTKCLRDRMDGHGDSYTEAKQFCDAGAGADRTNVEVQAAGDPLDDSSWVEYNVAWRALKKLNGIAADDDLASFMMSMTGTVILKRDAAKRMVDVEKPSLLTQPGELEALIAGGVALIYQCAGGSGEFECLDVNMVDKLIPADQAIAAKVNLLVQSIRDKIATDTALTLPEQGIVASSSVPIVKALTVAHAYSPLASTAMARRIGMMMGYDILYKYLEEVSGAIEIGMGGLTAAKDVRDRFKTQVEKVRQYLRDVKLNHSEQLTRTMAILEESSQWERYVMARMNPAVAKSISWSNAIR